jgi:hypothetical protein
MKIPRIHALALGTSLFACVALLPTKADAISLTLNLTGVWNGSICDASQIKDAIGNPVTGFTFNTVSISNGCKVLLNNVQIDVNGDGVNDILITDVSTSNLARIEIESDPLGKDRIALLGANIRMLTNVASSVTVLDVKVLSATVRPAAPKNGYQSLSDGGFVVTKAVTLSSTAFGQLCLSGTCSGPPHQFTDAFGSPDSLTILSSSGATSIDDRNEAFDCFQCSGTMQVFLELQIGLSALTANNRVIADGSTVFLADSVPAAQAICSIDPVTGLLIGSEGDIIDGLICYVNPLTNVPTLLPGADALAAARGECPPNLTQLCQQIRSMLTK